MVGHQVSHARTNICESLDSAVSSCVNTFIGIYWQLANDLNEDVGAVAETIQKASIGADLKAVSAVLGHTPHTDHSMSQVDVTCQVPSLVTPSKLQQPFSPLDPTPLFLPQIIPHPTLRHSPTLPPCPLHAILMHRSHPIPPRRTHPTPPHITPTPPHPTAHHQLRGITCVQ